MAATIGTAMLGLTRRLRPLPRSQVRSDPDARLLPAASRPSPRRCAATTTSILNAGAVSTGEGARGIASTRRSSRRASSFEKEQLPARFGGVASKAARAAATPQWLVLDSARGEVRRAARRSTQQADGSFLASGNNADARHLHVHGAACRPARHHGGAARSAAPTRRWSSAGPGRAANGNFALSDVSADGDAVRRDSRLASKLVKASADVRAERACRWRRRSTPTAERRGRSIRSSARITRRFSSSRRRSTAGRRQRR